VKQIVICAAVLMFISSWSWGQNCTNTSVGYKPLPELGSALYKNYQGGLYPSGQNQRPASHDSLGRALSLQVKPLNANGFVDALGGKIVLLSIGMSNTTQEFSAFLPLATADPLKNPQLVIVDGAQGGQTASIIADPNANFWTVIDQRLAAAGVTRQQVQVAWVKEANAGPTQAFPTHAQMLQSNLESVVRNLKSKYPNIKIAYCSSRTYGGYATSTLNPEPYAYESGFSVKWLIEKQINGDPTLAANGVAPVTPWLAWGPYLWADGTTPRSDGFTWQCSDVVTSDGTHPSNSGQQKVANLLLNFFKSEPTAIPWFLKSTPTSADEHGGNPVAGFVLYQNYPNPFNPTTTIHFILTRNEHARLGVYDLLGRETATLVNEELPAGEHVAKFSGETSKGESLPSGIYLYRLQTNSAMQQKAMVLVK
jgi:hypothetical protein